MDAGKLWILRDFIGTNKIQFKIPVYQRNYDWSESNCNRLLDDIKNIIDGGEKHFLGSIVYMSAEGGDFELKEYIVIDGQQRLTTMMLILKALVDIAKENDDRCYEEIQASYLQNSYCDEKNKIKLKPIKGDNDQFVALLNDKVDEVDKDSHIWLNYYICKKSMQIWVDQGIRASQILQSLAKLEMVYIQLKKGEDDPQIIFESINSTGLDLTNADLIRNFLLMNADNQEALFENYWLYIEKVLKRGTDYSNLNLFFVQYIIYKTNKPVVEANLYERFVKVFKEEGFDSETCLKELKYFADIFKVFVYESDAYTPMVRKSLRSLRMLKSTTTYPFLLHVFNDYKNGVISKVTLENVVQFIFAYLLRRNVCNVASNSLRGLFTALYGRVFKVAENKQKYYESINKFICTLNTKDTVPSDQEFERELKQINIYRSLSLCKFVLVDIENGDSKETLDVENLTIEHIMPQTLNMAWKHISKAEHDEYLHVLGNLSVSGYNSELSNKSFKEKKKIIQENSKAVILNSDVWDKDEWTIDCIKARGNRLAHIVMNRYAIERVEDDSIDFEYVSTISLGQCDKVTGRKLVNFKFDDATYLQSKFVLMLVDMMRILSDIDSHILSALADENYSFVGNNTHPRITKEKSLLRSPMDVSDGIYVELNTSAKDVMKFIAALLEKYQIDEARFSISVVAEEKDADDEEQETEDAI